MSQYLINKTFLTKKGNQIKIRIEFRNLQFTTEIIHNNVILSENKTSSTAMMNDSILPHIDNIETIEEVNKKMIELSKFIEQKFNDQEDES